VERQLSPITLLNYQRQLDAIMPWPMRRPEKLATM
jgi:site-specific recombinase XerC